jgi:ubiquinone/menaquinone biosynthesis C-methylase UbiE
VLEVGANKGEHVQFVRHDFDSYVLSDFRLPAEEIASLDDPRFTYRQADVQHLPFDDDSFDRTIVTCVLHHTSHPGLAAQEIRRVTAPGGVMSILLPCDPGLAYRAAWKNSSGRALRRRGVDDPYLVHAEEHPQHFAGLVAHLRASFAKDAVTVRWWPLPIPSWNVNLYTVWHVVKSHD